MLKRKIDTVLAQWKSTNERIGKRKGLVLTGARQVGKTSSVEAFASANYANVVKVDFADRPDYLQLLSQAQGSDDLIRRISAISSQPLGNGSTLVFIDEAQLHGDAITWVKYLVQDGRFDVIVSGSMLGLEIYNFRSLPVGYAAIAEMFPLDFEEFCWAQGLSEETIGELRSAYEERVPVADWLHDKMMRLFNLYVLVGGMPEPLQAYVDTQDTRLLRTLQGSIMQAYRADIARYVDSPLHAQRIKAIFDAIPSQLNKENKRFILNDLEKNRRYAELAVDFQWLGTAGVALPCYRATEPTFPLKLGLEPSKFKLYQSDVGLLFSALTVADVQLILAQNAAINFGSVYENAVAQELRAHGHDLAYYNTKRYGEVDFLIERGKPTCTLVEVKSGKASRAHKALDNLMAVRNYAIEEALVLHTGNVAVDGKVTYLPVYMAMFL